MPENPKREGSPRLLTVPEIVEKHGISRQTIHAYRQRGVFPQPAPEQGGSTRLRFREDEVDAFIAANPKRPGGRPRTDPETATEGEPVSALDHLTEVYGEAGQQDAEARQFAAELLAKHAHELAEKIRAWVADPMSDSGASEHGDRGNVLEAADLIDPPDEESGT